MFVVFVQMYRRTLPTYNMLYNWHLLDSQMYVALHKNICKMKLQHCVTVFPENVFWLDIQLYLGHVLTVGRESLCLTSILSPWVMYILIPPSIRFPPCRERSVQAGDTTAVWGLRGDHRWSSGRRRCQDPAGPAPPQTHLFSTARREGEREGGRRHGHRRPRGQRRRRGEGQERSQ